MGEQCQVGCQGTADATTEGSSEYPHTTATAAFRGPQVRFILMNSFSTSDDTKEHLRKKHAELIDEEDSELVQNKSPKVDAKTLKPAEHPANRDQEWCVPGGSFTRCSHRRCCSRRLHLHYCSRLPGHMAAGMQTPQTPDRPHAGWAAVTRPAPPHSLVHPGTRRRRCPPGHGDIYPALLGTGMLGRLREKGINYVFVSNSDNLGATLDLDLLAYFAQSGNGFLMEVCASTISNERSIL
jgi:UTP--glucose-1-phosphate uridylyltransferase